MKKIILFLTCILFVVGCSCNNDKASDAVEKYLNEYKGLSDNVLKDVDKLIEKEELEDFEGIIPEPLGDIVISIEKVKEQAEEYGHSFERELAYMLVHGFYHLRGYDHMEEDEKKIMREKEENVLSQLEIMR